MLLQNGTDVAYQLPGLLIPANSSGVVLSASRYLVDETLRRGLNTLYDKSLVQVNTEDDPLVADFPIRTDAENDLAEALAPRLILPEVSFSIETSVPFGRVLSCSGVFSPRGFGFEQSIVSPLIVPQSAGTIMQFNGLDIQDVPDLSDELDWAVFLWAMNLTGEQVLGVNLFGDVDTPVGRQGDNDGPGPLHIGSGEWGDAEADITGDQLTFDTETASINVSDDGAGSPWLVGCIVSVGAD